MKEFVLPYQRMLEAILNLLWKTIHIDQPLNERINDDVLVQLASRAQGKLECLNLVKCPKVTDDGLKRVLEANRRLTKVSSYSLTFFFLSFFF